MSSTNYNERSWGIDVASEINLWCQNKNLIIKRASGEITIKNNKGNLLFPDIILYGDESAKTIIQGWELKMPDTLIDDYKLIKNATKKANNLSLDSFLVWNVKNAVLYKKSDKSNFKIFKQWELNGIDKRDEVKPNEHIWKELLYDILNDLNYYFKNDEIRPIKIIDAMTGDTISDFILSHANVVANEIKLQCAKNSNLEANIAVWWSSAKNEYNKKAEKNSCLAKLVLMSWMNKLLFANLLKKNQSSAYKIDKIVGEISVEESIDIIYEISDNCDFKNIFQPQLAEQCIPSLTWKTLKSFNSFLIENRIDNFEPEILQEILINVVNTSSKKVSGQFPTPYNLALFLSLLVIENKSKNVLDPCCGTGTIIKAVYDLKREYFDEHSSMNSLWASDKFSFPLQLAMLSLINPHYMGEIFHIFQEDAINLFMNKDIAFHNPNNGDIEIVPLPQMDYIISNLPFVQQEDIKKFNDNIKETINDKIKNLTNDDTLELDGRSDLYNYLPFALWDLLSPTGKLGIIISNSWLGSDAGKKFYNILQQFYDVNYIVTSANGRWFENVDVVTNVLIMNKRINPNMPVNENNITSYITLNKNINELSSNEIKEICFKIISGTISEEDYSIVSYSKTEENELLKIGLSKNALFSDIKWLFEIKDKLISANNIFDISRGARRGWDKMFYPTNHEIEQDYIKGVIKDTKKVKSYVEGDNDKNDAFCCEKSLDELKDLGHIGTLKWINKFVNQKNGTGKPLPQVLALGSTNWYTMKPDTLAEICIGMNPDKRIFFIRLKEPKFVNQRLIRLERSDKNIDLKLANALLNSILGLFFVESLGFGRGLGALDLSATKFKDGLHMLNYKLLSKEDIHNIIKMYELLEKRPVFDMVEELEKKDKKNLDLTILKAFGIESYYEDILKSTLQLYNIRKTVEQ